jgi:hypothetical protein
MCCWTRIIAVWLLFVKGFFEKNDFFEKNFKLRKIEEMKKE